MYIIPAIDLKGGKIVRYRYGGYYDLIDCSIDTIKDLENQGVKMINIHDLDACESKNDNLPLIKKIRNNTNLIVQVSGGLRNTKRIRDVSRIAHRVALSEKIARKFDKIKDAVSDLEKEKLVLFVDIKNGCMKDGSDPLEFVLKFGKSFGYVAFRDTEREFNLNGIDDIFFKRAVESLPMHIMAAGGVGNLDHLKALRDAGVYGVLIGTAIYSGMGIEDAVKVSA